jgi:hypothetical protein
MASTYIYKTLATPTNSKKYTYSLWVKRGIVANQEILLSAGTGASDGDFLVFRSNDQIEWQMYHSGNVGILKTNRVFKDPTAWYHIQIAYDSANATAGDRMKMYINGVEETSFATDTQPTLNLVSRINSAVQHNIGYDTYGLAAGYFTGSLSHIHFIDGQAYTASTFGETDATDGMWKIKTSPSVTYGNNGFFLKMEDSSNMDLDSSGNGLTFTTSGTLTSTKDNPSNNFCTLNPLYGKVGVTYAFTNGNNVLSTSGGSGWHQAMGTLGASSGKWYYEAYANYAPGAYNTQLGWGSADFLALTKADGAIGSGATKPSFGLYDVGQLNYSTDSATAQETASWGAAWTSGDYLMFAADLDNGRFYYGKNGTWDTTSSSNPVAGTGGYSFTPGGHTYIPMMSLYYQDIITNFGNGYFTTTSAGATNADDNGNGVFKYDVPAGFYAICTKNIKEFG